jgi:DNA-binding LacI/PurR family transcriptional regulator
VTATDVARAAGVSQATVSYVLNNAPNQTIPEQTRQRVLAAVQELGYTPSAAARALRRGRSDSVLLILPDWPIGATVSALIEHVSLELERHGLHALVRRLGAEQPLMTLWREIEPAALIALGPLGAPEGALMEASGVPVVRALTSAADAPNDVFVVPQELTGALQVQHLAARGHRRIGYAAPRDQRLHGFLHLRLDGARRECLDLGLDAPVVEELELDVDSAKRAVERWRQLDQPVTAVCAYNDDYAFALLAGMRELDLAAPEDLAIIGVDNVPLAAFAYPPLTTVDQNIPLIAAHLAQVVVDQIAGVAPPPAPRSDAFSLVVRASA